MNKLTPQILAMYIGQKCQRSGYEGEFIMTGISYSPEQDWWFVDFKDDINSSHPDDVFLILRPLASMTEEEMKELVSIRFKPESEYVKSILDGSVASIDSVGFRVDYKLPNKPDLFKYYEWQEFRKLNPAQWTYMLSKGFDLFGLIDAGLAIDANKGE